MQKNLSPLFSKKVPWGEQGHHSHWVLSTVTLIMRKNPHFSPLVTGGFIITNKMKDRKKMKCKECKEKTNHILRGFIGHNARWCCLKCESEASE